MLELREGYWARAGLLRGQCLAAGRRARLADVLIAQACLDADLPLLTNDADFEVFKLIGGLKLVDV
jgi:predicted nucleic acid-binding protein